MTKLDKVMKSKGMTAYRLSKITGIDIRSLYYYTTGDRKLNKARYSTVQKIANALQVTAEDILDEM